MRRLAALCLIAIAALAGCSTDNATDPLQATDTLSVAQPAESPPSDQPDGTVLPAPATDHTVYDVSSNTVALAHGDTLSLYAADAMDQPPRTIQLPSAPASLRSHDGMFLTALPDSNVIATIDPRTTSVQRTPVAGGPIDAVHTGDQLAVALRGERSVTFLRDGKRTATATGFTRPAQLFATGDTVLVLDRMTTSVTPVDPRSGEKSAALRAGQGATHATTDRFGRLLITDTRVGQYLAFSADPLILKQRYPVGDTPYAVTYDPQRDLSWITLTGSNEIVGYDVAGGQPVERYRFSTVRQPNSVAVNPTTGAVYIASATGEGIQVVRP